MITIAEIKHQEKVVGRHYGAVRRLSKPDGNKALLQKAARAFQEAFRFFDYFNGSAPAHTPSLYQRIQAGELDAIEEAVRFLEADPCCVEAGYIKLKICKALRSAVLPESHRERLRQVIRAMPGWTARWLSFSATRSWRKPCTARNLPRPSAPCRRRRNTGGRGGSA